MNYLNMWLASDSRTRRALTATADRVDSELAVDADTKGEPSVSSTARILEIPILNTDAQVRVTFTVSADDRLVRVIRLSIQSD